MADFTIKQNDTRPALTGIVQQGPQQQVVNLTDSSVKFIMRAAGNGFVKVDGAAATITNALNGAISYIWLPRDTDTAGSYEGEFQVMFSDGGVETFPNDGYIDILIVDDAGN